VLGFYHLAESGITADVLGRHLTVETLVQRLLPTGLLLHTALKILLTIHCCFENRYFIKVSKKGFWNSKSKKMAPAGPLVWTEPEDFVRLTETSRHFVKKMTDKECHLADY
jgi:hypothetical protein